MTLATQACLLDRQPRELDPKLIAPIANVRNFIKPDGGLWTSTYLGLPAISEWVCWARAEEPAWARGGLYLLEPAADSRIYTIDEYADLAHLMSRYPSPSRNLDPDFMLATPDFERMALDYDALHLSVSGQQATQWGDHYKLIWDCESTLWFRWSFSKVQKLMDVSE